jgi:hypothetical protein
MPGWLEPAGADARPLRLRSWSDYPAASLTSPGSPGHSLNCAGRWATGGAATGRTNRRTCLRSPTVAAHEVPLSVMVLDMDWHVTETGIRSEATGPGTRGTRTSSPTRWRCWPSTTRSPDKPQPASRRRHRRTRGAYCRGAAGRYRPCTSSDGAVRHRRSGFATAYFEEASSAGGRRGRLLVDGLAAGRGIERGGLDRCGSSTTCTSATPANDRVTGRPPPDAAMRGRMGNHRYPIGSRATPSPRGDARRCRGPRRRPAGLAGGATMWAGTRVVTGTTAVCAVGSTRSSARHATALDQQAIARPAAVVAHVAGCSAGAMGAFPAKCRLVPCLYSMAWRAR